MNSKVHSGQRTESIKDFALPPFTVAVSGFFISADAGVFFDGILWSINNLLLCYHQIIGKWENTCQKTGKELVPIMSIDPYGDPFVACLLPCWTRQINACASLLVVVISWWQSAADTSPVSHPSSLNCILLAIVHEQMHKTYDILSFIDPRDDLSIDQLHTLLRGHKYCIHNSFICQAFRFIVQ